MGPLPVPEAGSPRGRCAQGQLCVCRWPRTGLCLRMAARGLLRARCVSQGPLPTGQSPVRPHLPDSLCSCPTSKCAHVPRSWGFGSQQVNFGDTVLLIRGNPTLMGWTRRPLRLWFLLLPLPGLHTLLGCTHWGDRPFIHSSIHSFMSGAGIHSFVYSFTRHAHSHSFIHSFLLHVWSIHSSMHVTCRSSFIHSFMPHAQPPSFIHPAHTIPLVCPALAPCWLWGLS